MLKQDSLISHNEKQKLQLFINCRNLDHPNYFTSIDSFLTIKLVEHKHPEKTILKTKVYLNDSNPNYTETVLVDFYFEIKQKLIFEVYHYGAPPKLMGSFETSVGAIFGSSEHGQTGNLQNKNQKTGQIIIRCEKQQNIHKQMVTLKLSAIGLPSLTWWYFFGATSAFYRIFRKHQRKETLVYESEIVTSTDPKWQQFKISQHKLISPNNTEFQLRIYNFSKRGNHQVIGSVELHLSYLKIGRQFKILNQSNKTCGTLIIDNYTNQIQYQFGDFIEAGLQLALVTCIDFTASNGVPFNQQSLHYVGRGKSQYELALQVVTEILLDYDFDKLVPVYGFGAKVKHPSLNSENITSFCFPINCNIDNPNIYQLSAILQTYRNILPYLTFAGPTKLSQLLSQAMKQCKQFQIIGTHYMILLILTDGDIHDKQQVIDLLIKCNQLPISVIIIGIGEGPFSIMHELDDDNCELVDSQGRHNRRDLVQFVQFAKFKNDGVILAKEVLIELPRQVIEYFKMINITPDDLKGISKNNFQLERNNVPHNREEQNKKQILMHRFDCQLLNLQQSIYKLKRIHKQIYNLYISKTTNIYYLSDGINFDAYNEYHFLFPFLVQLIFCQILQIMQLSQLFQKIVSIYLFIYFYQY